MKLPAAVQRQVDAAEQFESANRGDVQQPPQDPAPVPDTTPTDPPAPAQTELFTKEEAPAPQPVDNRYEVLKGKYDAEVPRLAKEAKEARERLEAQARELDELKRKLVKKEEPPEPKVTEKDVSDFGADMIDLIRRVSSETVSGNLLARLDASLAAIDSRIRALENAVGGVAETQKVTAEEKFYADLSKAVPTWEATNVDNKWLQWLALVDDMTGVTRQTLLDQAVGLMDANRVAAMFKRFYADNNINTNQTTPPAPKADDLSKQVSPSRATASAPVAEDKGQIWTDAAVRAFTKDISTGKFKGREELQARIQADLDAAFQDGRYRP